MAPYVVPSAGPLPAYGFFRRRLRPLGDARRARSGVFNSYSALLEARGGAQDQEGEILQEVADEAPASGVNNNRRRSRRRGRRRGHGAGGSADDDDDDAAGARGRGWSAAARFVAPALVLLVLVLFAAGGKRLILGEERRSSLQRVGGGRMYREERPRPEGS